MPFVKLTNACGRGNEKIHDPVYVVAEKVSHLSTNLATGHTLVVFDHGENAVVLESQEEVARRLVEASRPMSVLRRTVTVY